ncbi:MAG: SDR family oxidoreductase, partial [Actinomycetes bacterium]
MGLMDGKNILVTGVLTDHSIAFSVAKIIQEEDGNVVLSSFGRAMGATERANARLPKKAPIVELDVTNEDNLKNLKEEISKHCSTLDGVVHAIGFAP